MNRIAGGESDDQLALAEAREQQAAIAEILRVMADAPADVTVVLNAIAKEAAQLCRAPFARMTIIEGSILRPIAGYAADDQPAAAAGSVPLARTSIQGRAILEKRTLHYDDIAPMVEDEFPAAVDNARSMGFRAVLAVPLLRGNDGLGSIFLYRREPGLFSQSQVAVVEMFARQAAIALHSVQQFRATQEALEQQTATSEILHVISQTRDNVQPVFDLLAQRAGRLCDAEVAVVSRFDGREVHLAAVHGTTVEAVEIVRSLYPLALDSPTVTGRTIRSADVVHIADVLADETYGAKEFARAADYRASLGVPIMQAGQVVGSIFVGRSAPGLFSHARVELVRTFAQQAAIAIENVRMFREVETRNRDLSEALEQQTATSDILAIISRSPTDVQPVFDTIVANALRLCEGVFSAVYRFDGELIHIGALRNISPEGDVAFKRAYPCKPNRQGTTQRAILTGEMVHMPDVRLEPEYGYLDVAAEANFRSVLAVPMLCDGATIGAIAVHREFAGAFPEAKIALLKTFADQAVIAVENVRLFTELGARNRDLSEALDQQTATSGILRAISRSPTDVQPVFDNIAAAALNLCNAASALVTRLEGDNVVLVASANLTEEGAEAMRAAFPQPIGRQATSARAVREGRMILIPDVVADPDYKIQDLALRAAFRSTLAVPLMRDGRPIGTITVGKAEPGPFSDSQVALLETFAEQAVIAIENVRLFNELDARNRALTEALEQQTATSDILGVIARTPNDVQPVFDIIGERAALLCEAHVAVVSHIVDGRLALAAVHGVDHAAVTSIATHFPMPLDAEATSARAVRARGVIDDPDVLADPAYKAKDAAQAGQWRAGAAVPMFRHGEVVGAIFVGRKQPGHLPPGKIQLLKTFADQAVIAIENVRLFNELDARNRALSEALEQQTATSEILRVISRSQTDVQPVFDTIAASVLSLCRARFANVFTYDGELIHVAALVNDSPEYIETVQSYYPQPPGRNTAVTRAIATGEVCVIPDVLADPEYQFPRESAGGGFRSILAVPLMREGKPVGGIAVGRPDPGPFPELQVALLQTFADQAVIAIENVRLFNELEARTAQLGRSVDELRALGDVGQAVSSTLDLATVLSTIVSRARSLMAVEGASVYEYDEAREAFILRSADGLPSDLIDALHKTPMRPGEGALGRMALTRQPVEIADIADERAYQSRVRKLLVRLGLRSMLAVPLLRENHLLGGIVINRHEPGSFDPQVVDLLRTFATQSALAIQNARLYREIEIKSRELETASRHKSEFLANMSHELRTPLNAIIGFSEVLGERLFGELNAKQAEYVVDIAESGRHLLDLINDILDLSKIEAGRMELDASEIDLPRTIEQTLVLVRERAERRGIALSSAIGNGVGTIHADARKVKQVLLNLLSNALKFTPAGGRVEVRATAFDDRVEVSVADTGVGIAPEDQDAVFEEFRQVGASSAKAEGTGLGLAISRKFVELHGGRIFVRSTPGAGSTFTFTLPIRR